MGTRAHVRRVAENGADLTAELSEKLPDHLQALQDMAAIVTACVMVVSTMAVLALVVGMVRK